MYFVSEKLVPCSLQDEGVNETQNVSTHFERRLSPDCIWQRLGGIVITGRGGNVKMVGYYPKPASMSKREKDLDRNF